MPIRLLASLALFPVLVPAFAAEPASPELQRIQVFIGSHLPQATGVETVHAATCAAVDYRLVVSPAKKTVILSAGGRADADLTSTTVGARLLEEDVLVKVGFNCPMDAINVFIKGVKLIDLGAPQGFSDHLSVSSNGTVRTGRPKAEHVDEMARPHQSVRSLPPRAPAG